MQHLPETPITNTPRSLMAALALSTTSSHSFCETVASDSVTLTMGAAILKVVNL